MDTRIVLVERLQSEIMTDLCEWQLNYLDRGDIKAVERIESHLQTLSSACSVILLAAELSALESVKTAKWEKRYFEYKEAAEKHIAELNEIIKTEEYFLTKPKFNK